MEPTLPKTSEPDNSPTAPVADGRSFAEDSAQRSTPLVSVARPSGVTRSFVTIIIWLVVLFIVLVIIGVGWSYWQMQKSSTASDDVPVYEESEVAATDTETFGFADISSGDSLQDIAADIEQFDFTFSDDDFSDIESSINAL